MLFESIKRTEKLLEKFHLTELSNTDDIKSLEIIADELSGNKLMETGALLSGNSTDVAKIALLRAIVEQNFIIIRQLDRLTKK